MPGAPLAAQQPVTSSAPSAHDTTPPSLPRDRRVDAGDAATIASLLSAVDSVRRELSALRAEVATLRAERTERAIRPLSAVGAASTTLVRAGSTLPPFAPGDSIARPSAATAPAQATPQAQPPATLESGFGSLKFDGLLQTWYANGSQHGDNTLRIRRAVLKVSGKVAPHVSWAVMIDPAKALSLRQSSTSVGGQQVVTDESVNQSSRTLQDALVTIGLDHGYSVDVGQYKLPFAYEGPNPTSQVLTVERPQFASDRSRGGRLGDVRDIGVTLRGSVWPSSKLAVGVFDGTGEAQSATDANDQKVFVANLATPIPVLSGLTLGMSGVYGVSPNPEHARRDRIGALAEYLRPSVTARAEYIRGVDGDVHREGYYELLAYKLNKSFELVQRVDYFDPDVRRVGTIQDEGATDVLAGLNYYIAGHNAKLQLNAVNRSWRHHRFANTRQLLLNLQTAW
jgi:hypothetical protein